MSQDEALLQALAVRIEELKEAVTSLETRLEERCPNHARRIERIEMLLDGPPTNGNHPGLVSRMRSIEDAIRRMDRTRAWAFGVAGTAVGGLVVAIAEKLL